MDDAVPHSSPGALPASLMHTRKHHRVVHQAARFHEYSIDTANALRVTLSAEFPTVAFTQMS